MAGQRSILRDLQCPLWVIRADFGMSEICPVTGNPGSISPPVFPVEDVGVDLIQARRPDRRHKTFLHRVAATSPRPQRKLSSQFNTSTRRANHFDLSEIMSSPSRKNILIFRNRKSDYIPRHPVPLRGRRPSSRTLGGLRWTLMSRRRTWLKRTVKTRGPGAPLLASSSREANADRG